MYTSQTLTNIGPALLKAQVLMGGAVKGSKNPYFKSTYADLGAVLAACKDLLNDEGIIILQPVNRDSSGTFVESTLLHAASGEFISSVTPVVFAKEGDPQAQGSAITYARRYGLQSLLSMPAEDDDGEKAMVRKPKAETKVVTIVTETSTDVLETKITPKVETGEKPKTSFRKPKPDVETTGKTLSNGASDDLGLS